MNPFEQKVNELKESLRGVPFSSRAHMRLGIIRNLTFVPQFDILPKNIDNDKPILLYGAGKFGKAAAEFLCSIGVTPTAFVDSNSDVEAIVVNESKIPVASFDTLVSQYSNAYVAITVADSDFYSEISNKLTQAGIAYCDIVGYYIIAGLKRTYMIVEDELSKLQVLDSMKYLVSYSRYYEHYFDECICSKLTDNEVFVDIGVYNGDTILDFIERVNGKYKHIYGFEANKNVYSKYQGRVSELNNVTYENLGVWCEDAQLELEEGEESSSSFLTEYYEKSYFVQCTSLDNYFLAKPFEALPTFIKADVEGAEIEVLRGAKEVIKQKHPKLAICVYHKTEHFWQIPELIKKIDPTYKFFLRHYSPDDEREFVLFAV